MAMNTFIDKLPYRSRLSSQPVLTSPEHPVAFST